MPVTLSDLTSELQLRIEKVDGVPALRRAGVFELVKGVFDIISQALEAGEQVVVPRFGKFEIKRRPARSGRNPITGDAISIPEKGGVKFRTASALKVRVLDTVPIASEREKLPKKDSEPKAAKKK